MYSLNPADYNSIEEFIVALDAMISRDANQLGSAMALGIDHADIYKEALDKYLLRMSYEHTEDASALFFEGSTIPVTIPLTADMTFIYSDATEI
jgi:hypothetical protein